MSSKRVVLYYDDPYDKEIVEFLASLPARRVSEKLREVVRDGILLRQQERRK